MPWRFVEGISLDTDEAIKEYSKAYNFLFYKRCLTAGEIAVYLGHRRIWEAFLKSGDDYALVLEDDFQIIDQVALKASIKDAVTHPGRWDMVKFFDAQRKRPVASLMLGTSRFVCAKYPPFGTVAYLINVETARTLLARQRIYRPIDEDHCRPWEFPLRVWSSEPPFIVENSIGLGGSMLTEGREKIERLRGKNLFRRIIMRNLQELSKSLAAKRYQRMMQNSVEM